MNQITKLTHSRVYRGGIKGKNGLPSATSKVSLEINIQERCLDLRFLLGEYSERVSSVVLSIQIDDFPVLQSAIATIEAANRDRLLATLKEQKQLIAQLQAKHLEQTK